MLLYWFQGFLHAKKKTLKTFLEINFVYASLWLFLRIKNTEKTLEQTNSLTILWMRFLCWSKKAFFSCSSQQPIDFWLTIKRQRKFSKFKFTLRLHFKKKKKSFQVGGGIFRDFLCNPRHLIIVTKPEMKTCIKSRKRDGKLTIRVP